MIAGCIIFILIVKVEVKNVLLIAFPLFLVLHFTPPSIFVEVMRNVCGIFLDSQKEGFFLRPLASDMTSYVHVEC